MPSLRRHQPAPAAVGLLSLASRASAIALVFWTARLLGGAAMSALTGARTPDPIAELAAGGIVAVTLGWLAPRLRGSAPTRVAIVGLVLFVNVVAVMIEGAAFAPESSPLGSLPLQLLPQGLVGLLVAGVAVALLRRDGPDASVAEPERGVGWWAVRLAATTSVYVVAYFVTGAITYVLVTGPYYKLHAGGLTTPALPVVLGLALLEGLLLTLGTIPLVRRLAGTRWARRLSAGLVLSILGGVVPLVQATNLPDVIRVASAIEILFQKLPLGVAIAAFLGPERDQVGRVRPGGGSSTPQSP